jgi:hypothetical protein
LDIFQIIHGRFFIIQGVKEFRGCGGLELLKNFRSTAFRGVGEEGALRYREDLSSDLDDILVEPRGLVFETPPWSSRGMRT